MARERSAAELSCRGRGACPRSRSLGPWLVFRPQRCSRYWISWRARFLSRCVRWEPTGRAAKRNPNPADSWKRRRLLTRKRSFTSTLCHVDCKYNPYAGEVPFLEPNEHALEGLQEALTCGQVLCSASGIFLCSVSVVGIPYLIAKTHLIRKGEIGCVGDERGGRYCCLQCFASHAGSSRGSYRRRLCQHNDGTIRVLPTGWHLMETFGTEVRRFPLQEDSACATCP